MTPFVRRLFFPVGGPPLSICNRPCPSNDLDDFLVHFSQQLQNPKESEAASSDHSDAWRL